MSDKPNDEPRPEITRVRMFLGLELSKLVDDKEIEQLLEKYSSPIDVAAIIRFRRQGGTGI